jgi:Putative peptidoglycan binding domain/HlyD family secretion protein
MISEQSAGEVAADPPRAPARRRRWRLAAAGGVVVIAAAAVTVGVTRPFAAPAAASHGIGDTATEPVTDQSLSEQTTANGSLGYAHSYNVVVAGSGQSSASGQGADGTGSPAGAAGQGAAGQGSAGQDSGGSQPGGTFTWLPAVGKVIRQGHRLYSVNGAPVVLLYGAVPAYRSLSEGMSGADVRQLNGDLVALGYATRPALGPGSSYFGAATARAVGKLQARLGLTRTGSLPLGQAAFLPTAAKVSGVSASLGDPAQVGTDVLEATSTKRQVTAQLDATLQSDVKVGDQVTITLPNNQTTPGAVTSVGTVATSPAAGSGSGPGSASGAAGSSSAGSSSSGSSGTSGAAADIQVNIKPTDPAATGTLTQAPVDITITTASVQHATVVPVDALLARGGGGYAVEVAGPGDSRHLVPVSLGMFDDADGLVQVTGSRLTAGERVVVPQL